MHINNRPPSTTPVEQSTGPSTGKMTVSNTAGSDAPSMSNLKNQLTPRSEDYLSRFKHHGSLTEKAMANAASTALEHDRFLANPGREKPVTQFGVTMNLNGCKGMLLANFTSHNDRLELEALAFREERFFEAEAGKIEMVVLDRARDLPEVKPHQPSAEEADARAESAGVESDANAGAHADAEGAVADTPPALPPEKPLSDREIAEAKKALDKDIKRFDNQTMQRKMASKLADTQIKEGRYNSRFTALPAAHASVASARITAKTTQVSAKAKEAVTTYFQQAFGLEEKSRPALRPAPVEPAAIVDVPAGQQYQFSKHEFADFYEEHWLPLRENTAEPEHADTALSTQTSRPGSATGLPDSAGSTQPTALPRRHARFINQDIQNALRQQLEAGSSSPTSLAETLPQNAQTSRPGSAAGLPDSPDVTQPGASSRRYAQLFSQDLQSELQQQLESGSSSSSSAADSAPQNRRYGANFDEQFINQLKERLNNLPSRQEK